MRLTEPEAGSGSASDRHRAQLIAALLATVLSLGVGTAAVNASASPQASSAKKCKHGKKHKPCHRPKSTKPAKGRISLTNCPTADLIPNAPYTFTGRLSPRRGGVGS